MNHTYKVIFSQALGKFVVVSENVKGRGKSSKAGVVLAMALVVGANAYAAPTGGSVVAGNANIIYSGKLTTISQETNRAVINWNTFNIGKGETVQFNQPSANAATLNRVLTATPSVIDGILKSNGNVFLVNAAGVMIGKDASVNVGGLVASTLDIKDADFMAGKNHFEGESTKSVENYGDITVSNGGIAALIGAKVNNVGYITAHEGSAMLVAAGSVTLTLGEGAAAHSLVIEKSILDALVEAGGAVRVGGGQIVLAAHAANSLLKKAINQTGVLEAISMTQQGGNIVLDGGAMGRVDVTGSVQADGKTGGKVVVTGHDVLVSGDISATGTGKGGDVFIGGGYRGQDPAIHNAENIAVTRSATVDVSSKIDGDAGQAIMFSTGSTQVKGDLKAKGGAIAGNGGLVETSGKVVQFDGRVDTKATNGKSGGYLLDPDMIIITAGAAEPDDADLPEIVGTDPGEGGATGVGSTTTISKAALEAISSGYISLEADGYIRIEDLSANGGSGMINLQTDTDLELITNNRDRPFTPIPGQSGNGGIYFINSNNSIRTSGTGNISLRAGKYNSGLQVNAGLFNIGNIDVEDGDIELFGSSVVDIKGNVSASGAGSIFIDADHDISQDGKLTITSTVSANRGDITLSGGNGVDITGSIKLNEGNVYLSGNSGIEEHRLSGSIEKTGADLYIEQPLTMTGNSATIKSGGVLGFGDYVNFDDGVNATLIGTNFAIPYGFSSLGTSATVNIKAPDFIGNISLDQYGGSGYSPILERLTGVTQVNIGSNDYRGKITMAGLAATQILNVTANGTGGSIEFLDGGYMGSGNVHIRANADITFTGFYNISAYINDIVAGGNLSVLEPTTRFDGTLHKISVGNSFTNAAGNSLTDAVMDTRIYLNDASKLTGSGYTLADGFRRYGCTYDGGCTTGAVVPVTGDGFLFKQAPVLNLTPDNKTVTYGTANPLSGIGYTISGYVNGDTQASAGISGAGSVNFADAPVLSGAGYVPVDSYALKVDNGTLTNTMGYTFQSNNANTSLTVTKKNAAINVTALNKAYTGNTTAFFSSDSSDLFIEDSIVVLTDGTFSDKNVGTAKTVNYTINLGGLDANNYNLTSTSGTTTANITPKLLTNSVSTTNKTYDRTTTASSTISIGGKIAGDDIAASITASNFSDKNAGANKYVTSTATLTGADAGNYVLAGGATKTSYATIFQKSLASGAFTYDKVYDGTTNATTEVSINGVISGDTVNASVGSSVFDNKNVGNSKSVTTVIALTGADAANYRTSSSNEQTIAHITPRAVDATVTTQHKVYDGTTTAASSVSLSNVVAGDTVAGTVGTSVFSDKNAGTGKTVNSTVSLSGTDAVNYVISGGSGKTSTANITRKILSEPSFTVDNKVYDGYTFGSGDIDSLTGIVAGDTVNAIGVFAFADKNVGTAKQVDVSFGLTGADRNNYQLASPTVTGYADITPLALSVTNVVTTNKVYDGTTTAVTSASFDGVIGSDIVTAAISSSNFDNKNVGTGKQVNSIVALAGADAGNYTITGGSITSTADVTPKSVDAINVVTANKEYDRTRNAVTTGNVQGAIAGDVVSVGTTSSLFATKNAGNGKQVDSILNLTGADAGNYSLSNSVATTFANITKKLLAAPNIILYDKVYDGGTFANRDTDPLVGVVTGDDVGYIHFANFVDKNVGNNKQVNINVGLNGLDANNYMFASNTITKTASITPKSLTAISVSTSTKIYDGTTNASTTANLTGVVGGDSVTLNTVSSNFDNKNAGSNKSVTTEFTLTGTGANNYTLSNASATSAGTIDKKTVTTTIYTDDKVYDGTNVASSFVVMGGKVAGDNLQVQLNSSNFNDKNVGAAKVVSNNYSLIGADAANYSFDYANRDSFASITPKSITASGVVTANKVYDGTRDAVTTGTLTGVVGGDAVSLGTSASLFDTKNAGIGKTVTSTLALTGADAVNYTLTSTSATSFADITKKILTAGAGVSSKTYDGNTSASALPSFSNAQLVGGDLVNVFVSSANFVDKNAGFGKTVNVTLGLGGNDAANYQLATPAFTRTADITQKTVSTIISTANKVYDGTTTANTTVSIGGKVTGDDVGVVLNSSTFGDKNAGNTKLVTNDYSLTGADAGNYRFSMGGNQSTYADITKKSIASPTISVIGRQYDGTTNASAIIGSLAGVVSGDNVTTNYNASFSDKNVGTGKSVSVSLSLAGADSSNYKLTSPNVASTGDIYKRQISVVDIVTDNKVYDGTEGANTTATLANTIAGDDIALKLLASSFREKDVADSKPVDNYFGLHGADGDNYELTSNYNVTFANITPKMIRGSFSADDKTYDGTTSATVHVSTEASDVVAGDDVYIGGTGAFRDKNKGINKFVDVNYTLNGADAGNYYLQQATDWNYANIYAKSISAINLVTNDKMYNRNTSASSTADLSGVITGDTVAVTVASNFGDWNAGVNKAVSSTFMLAGPDATNYVLSSTTGNSTATITPKLIAAPTVTAVNKVYDGNTAAAATIGTLSGVIAGDSGGVVVNYIGNFNNKNVGTNKNVTYDLGLQGTSAGNYQLTSTQVIKNNGVIFSKALNVDNIVSSNKVYDGATNATTTGQLSGVVAGDTANLQQTYSVFTNKNVGTGKEILTGWYLTGADAGNYSINNSFTQTYADITPKHILAINAKSFDKVYDGTTSAVTTADLQGLIGADVVSATTSVSNFDNKNAGLGKTVTSTLALTGADASNYVLDNVNATTTAGIAKKQISADGITTASKVYDGTTNAITTANTGLIIVGDAATVTVTSSNFTNKNVGVGKTVNSTLELAGADANNYYLDNPNVTTNADITQRILNSVGTSTLDKVYDGTTSANTSLIYDPTEIVSGDNLNIDILASSFDNKNAGFNKDVTSVLGLSGSDSGNYRLSSASSSSYASVEQRVVTATNITSANKVYDGTTAAITIGDLTGVMTGDDVAMATALSAFSDKNAGIGKTVTSSLTLAGADSNNYILSNESATSTANIDKKAVTAQVLSTLDKVYDGTTATYAYAGSDDFIASDMVGLATVTSNFADKNVGTGKTVTTKVELGGDDAGNYTLNNDTLTSTAAITKRQLNAINVVTQDKVYDGSAIATTTAELDDVIAGDAVTVSTVSSQFDNKNAGFNKNVNSVVAISGADAGNYELNSANASSNASIDQRIISATNVTTANKVYDGTTAAVTTGTLQNIIAGDDVVMATASSAFTDKNVGTGKTVTSSLTLAGADSNNYLLDNENAVSTADITPKHVNAINVLTANKVYDGTTFAVTTAQVDGVVGGDLVGVGTYDSNFDNKNVGVGKTVTSTLGLYGDDAANYVLDNASATSTASITSKAVNIINVVTANKVYDGTTAASTTAQVDGVATGDNVTVAMTSSAFADKNVGTNKQVNSVFSFGGADAANYTFISNNAVSYADITPKTFAFALSTVTKVYDGSTTANTSLNGMLGVVAGDNVVVNILGSNFEDKKAGNAKLVYTDVSYGGADIGNYILPSTIRTSLGTITPKGINLVNVVTGNKVYDGNTNASTTAGLSGLIAGDVVNATTTSSTFNNKNAGVGKAVNSVFSLTGADFESYYLISTNAASAADISRKDINAINGVTATKAYDGTTTATTTAQLTGVISGDAVSAVTTSSVFDNKNAGTNKNVVSGLALSGADAGNYNLDSTTLLTTGTITAKAINAINVTTADKVYDGTTSANTTAAVAGLVGGDAVGVSTTSSNFVDKNAGNGKTVNSVLSLTGVDAGNYVLDNANATSTAAITPKHVLATNATTANKAYDGTTNAVTTAELLDGIAGDSVSVTSSSASFSDKNVGTGKTVTSTLTLAGSDAGNYILDTVNATTTADITQKHINASNFQTLDKVYDGTTSANTVADLDGVVAGDVVTTAVVTSEFADKNAGNNKAVNSTLTIAGADAGNYVLDNASATSTGNITPKHITATGVTTSNKVYDGTTAAITTATAQDLVAGDTVTVTTSSSAFDNKNVGTSKTVNSVLALAGADAGNYVLDNQNATSTADVTQKHISAITATTSSKEYDGTTTATTTAVMADAAVGDILNLDQLTSEFSDKNAGVGKTVTSTFALSGADAGNYILDSNTATSQADITQKHISATNIVSSNKVYDGSTAAVTTADLSGIIAGDSVAMSTATSSFDNKNAGTGKTVTSTLALSGVDAANYVLDNQTATSTADITAKHVNAVNVVTSNKVYDGTTAATTTAELDDLIAGDVVTVTSSSAAFADKNVGTGKAVTSQLILGGADASNYVLDNQNAASTANITARLVTASDIVTANKVYDGTTTANTTATINNLIAGDSVSVSTVASSFNDKNAGLNKAVTTTFALSGADAGNYALDSATANSTGTITAKHINAANVTTANKVYDGTTNATTTAALNDLVAGDTVTVTTSSSNFDTKNVGNGKNVTSTLTLAGADAGNYVLDNTNATSVANITPKHVSAVNVVTANKVYDGSTSASTTATVQDMVAGDVVTVTTTSSNFNDKNAGVNKTVTSTLSLSGVDAANYVLDNAGNASSTASITKKTISAISSTASKVYDGTTAAQTTASLRDVIAGDNVTVSTAGSVFNDKNVGNNKTVTTNLSLGGSDGANYVLDSTSSTNTASITPKHISAINVSTADKVYDGSAQATTTAALNGLVSGDNVNVSTQSSSFSDKNVGASKTVNSTLTLAGGDSANYVLDNAQATSTAAITPKHINASNVTTANREYNGTTAATTTAALSGIIGGDSVVTKALSSNFADKNAGNGKSVETTFALDGIDARNYVLDNQTATSTANITPKTLTSSGLVFGSKTYDGSRDAVSAISVGSLNGVIAGDDVRNAILNAEFSDKNAGSGKAVTATLTLTGADATNYIMATPNVNGLASITPKAISAVGGVAQDKVYDSNIIAQILGANLNGAISGDNVVVGATGSFSDKNAGINKAVTINYSLNGADASNYVLSQTVGASIATIFRKVIDFATTTSGPTEFVTKDAPLSTDGFSGSLQGVIAGDNVSAGAIGFMQGETLSDASKPGSYRAVVMGLVGSDAANYDLNGKSDYSLNNSVRILVKPSATVTPPGKANKPPVFQNDVTFNPLYANGRPIETRGQVATAITITTDVIDLYKGANTAGGRSYTLPDGIDVSEIDPDLLYIPYDDVNLKPTSRGIAQSQYAISGVLDAPKQEEPVEKKK